jgi:hypothetical protein
VGSNVTVMLRSASFVMGRAVIASVPRAVCTVTRGSARTLRYQWDRSPYAAVTNLRPSRSRKMTIVWRGSPLRRPLVVSIMKARPTIGASPSL